MAMSFGNYDIAIFYLLFKVGILIGSKGGCSRFKLARICTQAHRRSEIFSLQIRLLFRQDIYNRMRSFLLDFSGMSVFNAAHIARKLYGRNLHSVTEAKIWNIIFAAEFGS